MAFINHLMMSERRNSSSASSTAKYRRDRSLGNLKINGSVEPR